MNALERNLKHSQVKKNLKKEAMTARMMKVITGTGHFCFLGGKQIIDIIELSKEIEM